MCGAEPIRRGRCSCYPPRPLGIPRGARSCDAVRDVRQCPVAKARGFHERCCRGVPSNLDRSCLRNVVALFHVLEKEMAWRSSKSKLGGGYGALKSFKPIVAVGAEHPLEEDLIKADHFRKIVTHQLYFRGS